MVLTPRMDFGVTEAGLMLRTPLVRTLAAPMLRTTSPSWEVARMASALVEVIRPVVETVMSPSPLLARMAWS
ncbi:hypothetical protein D3C86_1397250 [compost metagenome]